MHQYLEQNIQSLLAQYPPLGPVLSEAGIGCTTCSLGSCRVKDILEIHNLGAEASRDLLARMGEVIYGAASFEVPVLEHRVVQAPATFCPPIARMVEEHAYVKRVIALIPALIGQAGEEGFQDLAQGTLDFIRTYADGYHHAKEEDILFGYFDEGSGILAVMRQDHREGRSHVQASATALGSGDWASLGRHLGAYGELLLGHIHREDTIFYPWMDRSLPMRQVGELFARCQDVERAFAGVAMDQEAFVVRLEARLRS